MKRSFILLLGISILFPPPTWGAIPRVKLSRVIDEQKLGLEYEKTSIRKKYLKDGRLYIRLKKGKIPRKQHAGLRKMCLRKSSSNHYCRWILQATRGPRKKKYSRRRHRRHRTSLRKIQKRLETAKVSALSKTSEKRLNRALRKYKSFEPLLAITGKALGAKRCPGVALLTTLGLKAEEYFPEKSFRKLSLDLYRKAVKCGKYYNTIKARYRLAINQVWNKQYRQALDLMSDLATNPAARAYRPRALFWQAECAEHLGKSKIKQKAIGALVEEYPFILHSMVVAPEKTEKMFSDLAKRNPAVGFRSRKKPKLNMFLRAAEGMILLGEKKYARNILSGLVYYSLKSEPEVQLYLASLYERIDDVYHTFKLLSQTHMQYPELVSLYSLGMLYPYEFEKHLSKATNVDRLLLLSLIKQESSFNTGARSPAGALGLMQILPKTARKIERVSRKSLFNPKTNIRIGSKYIKRLMKNYDNDVEIVLAAYNAGKKHVDSWLRRYPAKDRMLFFDLVPFRETRGYVTSIARNYFWYRKLYPKKGTNRKPAGKQVRKNVKFELLDSLM